VLKNKNDQETTASRKPLFLEKETAKTLKPNQKLIKIRPATRKRVFTFIASLLNKVGYEQQRAEYFAYRVRWRIS